MRLGLLSTTGLLLVLRAGAHSWLDCLNWDDATMSCKGYPRGWATKRAEPFGQDVGRDSQPGASITEAAGGLLCPGSERAGANAYTTQYPRAILPVGSELMLRWPAKNHANVNAGPGTVEMLIARTPDTDDFSHITSKSAWLASCTARGGICQRPFASHPQNADCQTPGVDRAECKATYKLPTDLSPGTYTIMWWWEFNPGQYYNSCAEVQVTAAADGGDSGGDITLEVKFNVNKLSQDLPREMKAAVASHFDLKSAQVDVTGCEYTSSVETEITVSIQNLGQDQFDIIGARMDSTTDMQSIFDQASVDVTVIGITGYPTAVNHESGGGCSGDGSSVDAGAIVGVVFGLGSAAAIGLFCLWRRRQAERREKATAPREKEMKSFKEWSVETDPETGETYYFNSDTGESTWDDPRQQSKPAVPQAPPLPARTRMVPQV